MDDSFIICKESVRADVKNCENFFRVVVVDDVSQFGGVHVTDARSAFGVLKAELFFGSVRVFAEN